METFFVAEGTFSEISWLWYVIAVITAFGTGAIWYTLLFGKQWVKAVNYECLCGANISKGDKCTCNNRFPWEMIFQLIGTALIGLMYFILTPISVWLSVIVCIAFAGWTKSMLKFQIASWNRYITLASIDVGYFIVVSAIFVLFSYL